jgi:TatD DNase family protein
MLVDTHAHLMDPAFAGEVDTVLERAAAAGVTTIVCVGYDLDSSRAAVELAATYPCIFATVGVHPNYLAAAPSDWLCHVRELARAPRVVAIGETGLDYYRTYTLPDVQRQGLLAHRELADELSLPTVIHCREAEADLLATLGATPSSGRGSVLHCFSGAMTTMEAAIAAGCYISLAGTVTFKSAAPLRVVAAAVPAERLLVETDCPYLSPMPHRGQRNEPAHVRLTAACVAEARSESLERVAQQTTANAARLFGWATEAGA